MGPQQQARDQLVKEVSNIVTKKYLLKVSMYLQSVNFMNLKKIKKLQAYAELTFMTHLDKNVCQLAKRQRQFLILIRDACTALMREVQSSLDSDWNVDPTLEIREALTKLQLALMDAKDPKEVHLLFPELAMKKQALQVYY